MKSQLRALIAQGIDALRSAGTLPADTATPDFVVERPKTREHGDFASNAAMLLAKPARSNPRALAQALVAALPASDDIAKVEIAGPGFINFHMSPAAYQREVAAALQQGRAYGLQHVAARARWPAWNTFRPIPPARCTSAMAAPRRSAIASPACCRPMAGTSVREFYYNDAGVQIENLALSVQARAKGLKPDDAGWPEAGYRGDYIQDVADAYLRGETVESDGHAITGAGDADDLDAIRRFAVACLRREQNGDLAAFDVAFDTYFLESSLYDDGKVAETVERLNATGHTYEEGGALWLRTTDFGDDKDRVMRKSDGTFTYFLPDVAYHLSKWQRGYGRAITELGADHHGSLARVRAGLQALDVGIPEGLARIRAAPDGHGDARRRGSETLQARRQLLHPARSDRGSRPRCHALVPDRAQARFAADLRHRPGPPAEQRQSGVLRPVRACARLQPAAPGGGKGLCLRPGQRPGASGRAGRRDLAVADGGAVAFSGSGGERRAAAGAAPHRAIPARTGLCFPHLVPRHPGAGGRPGTRATRAWRWRCAARQVLANGLELLGVSAPEKM